MRRRVWLLVPALVAAIGLGIGPAGAITFGANDDGRHPWVGVAVFFGADGVPIQRCSGSLISATTFLTAGHCTAAPAVLARIWFDEGPIPCDLAYAGGNCTARVSCNEGGPFSGYPCAGEDASGVPIPNPNWNGTLTLPQTSDLGVVEIAPPASSLPTSYGRLAGLGAVDRLAASSTKKDPVSLTIVGYGLQSAKPHVASVLQRMLATVDLDTANQSLTSDWNVEFTSHPKQHPAEGDTAGRACYGDSGGPVLADEGDGEVIVGVVSFLLTTNCNGDAVGYRVDTQYAQDFVADPSVGQ